MPAATGRNKRRTPAPERRREEIADAALAVLAAEGSRGLTHRAVDEAAGLPSGSTSNHFRTREALLEAAARRHAELDMPPPADVDAASAPVGTVTPEQRRALIIAQLDRVLEPQRRSLLTARYELALEATRRPTLHAVMNESRARFVELAEILLTAAGCATPAAHAPQLLTVLDGIAADQLQATGDTLDRAGIEETIDRFLETC